MCFKWSEIWFTGGMSRKVWENNKNVIHACMEQELEILIDKDTKEIYKYTWADGNRWYRLVWD